MLSIRERTKEAVTNLLWLHAEDWLRYNELCKLGHTEEAGALNPASRNGNSPLYVALDLVGIPQDNTEMFSDDEIQKADGDPPGMFCRDSFTLEFDSGMARWKENIPEPDDISNFIETYLSEVFEVAKRYAEEFGIEVLDL